MKEIVGFLSTDSQLTNQLLSVVSLYFLESVAKDSNFTVDGVCQNLQLLGVVQDLNPLGVGVIANREGSRDRGSEVPHFLLCITETLSHIVERLELGDSVGLHRRLLQLQGEQLRLVR